MSWHQLHHFFFCGTVFRHRYEQSITISSLLHIQSPTSSTFAVPDLSDTGSLASCDELSCAWLNQLNSALWVGEITQPLQPLSVCENSFRRGGLDRPRDGGRLFSLQWETQLMRLPNPLQTACQHKSQTAPSLSTCKFTSSAAQEGNVN